MEALQTFWMEWGNLIMIVVGVLVGALVVGFIAAQMAKGAVSKVTRRFDVNKITAEITEAVSQKVAQAITGKTLDVDVSAIVEEKLDQTLGSIVLELGGVKEKVESMRRVSALTAKAVSKSKLLDPDEKAELTAAGDVLAADTVRAEKPVLKVKVAAKTEDKPAEKTAEKAARSSGALPI